MSARSLKKNRRSEDEGPASDLATLNLEGLLEGARAPSAIDGSREAAGFDEDTAGLFASLALALPAGTIDKADIAVSQDGGGNPQGAQQAGPVLPVAALDAVATDPIEIGGIEWARVENEGVWNSLKNLALDSFDPAWGDHLLLANFVDVRADLSGADAVDLAVTVVGAKRGELATGDGDDAVEWYLHSNSTDWANAISIETGGGDDSVLVSTVARTTLDDDLLADNPEPGNGWRWKPGYDGGFSFVVVDGGEGDDVIAADGKFTLHAFGGAGDDELIAGEGHSRLSGGADDDLFRLALTTAAGDVLVDFRGGSAGGGDVIELEGFGAGATLQHLGGGQWLASGSAGNAAFSVRDGAAIVTTMTEGEDYFFV